MKKENSDEKNPDKKEDENPEEKPQSADKPDIDEKKREKSAGSRNKVSEVINI